MSPSNLICEATQFAVAATNQNAVSLHTAPVKADSESSDDPCNTANDSMTVLIGRSHGELNRFKATLFI